MELIDGPRMERREARVTVGLRRRVPFRGMLAVRDSLLTELYAALERSEIQPDGPFFLRLHTVDMAGQMDIEVGVFAQADSPPAGLAAGESPAGDYAVLTYRDHSLRANKQLQEWARAEGLTFDVTPSADGDKWAGRFEIYLTDPRTERRKTRWVTQLAFLTR